MKELADRIEKRMLVERVAPRLHPNGFITLDLSETEKLHVWPDAPMRRRDDEGFIHDHVFSFRSVVIVGCLLDTRFDVHASQTGGSLYGVPCRRGRTHAEPQETVRDPGSFKATAVSRQKVKAGNTYEIPARTFHRSDPIGFTATYVTLTDFGTEPYARVLVPPPHELRPFDRTLTEDELAFAAFTIGRVSLLLRS